MASRRKTATRPVIAISIAAIAGIVVLALWFAGVIGSSSPYARVEAAAGWNNDCYPKTIVPAQAKFSRWAGPRASAVGLGCGTNGSFLNYARFRDERTAMSALKRHAPPVPVCVVGSEIIAGEIPPQPGDNTRALCANLHGTIHR